MQGGTYGRRTGRARSQRVTIGSSLCAGVGTDDPASASSIVDNHRLAKRVTQFLADDPHGHVDTAAWRKGHDHVDGPVGVTTDFR